MTVEFFDAHFHIWDIGEGSKSGHEPTNLFPPDGKKVFLKSDYEQLFAGLPTKPIQLKHSGGVYLEAVSVCHVGLSGPEYSKHCLAEARFATKQLSNNYVIVPTCALEQEDAKDVLKKLAKNRRVKGIRQILNLNPACSPRNDFLGELLDKPQWEKGFAELHPAGLSFDMQLNPHQFAKATAILAKYPDTTVIINHLGQPLLKDLNEDKDQFWSGMEALAKLPNTFMKISMLCRIDKNFNKLGEVEEAVHKVIKLFGASRCMFASNYPVDYGLPDVFGSWTSEKLFDYFICIAAKYSQSERDDLFAGTARRAYRAKAPVPRPLKKPKFSKISSIKPEQRGVNVFGKVIKAPEAVNESTFTVVIGDDTGLVTLRILGERASLCTVGSTMRVQNARVSMVNNFIQVQVDKWAALKAADEESIVETVNEKSDISAVEYELK